MNWLIMTMIIIISALVGFGFLYLYVKIFVWLIDYYTEHNNGKN